MDSGIETNDSASEADKVSKVTLSLRMFYFTLIALPKVKPLAKSQGTLYECGATF